MGGEAGSVDRLKLARAAGGTSLRDFFGDGSLTDLASFETTASRSPQDEEGWCGFFSVLRDDRFAVSSG
jgi:hypothetical protein